MRCIITEPDPFIQIKIWKHDINCWTYHLLTLCIKQIRRSVESGYGTYGLNFRMEIKHIGYAETTPAVT